jgi:hypothetical protein
MLRRTLEQPYYKLEGKRDPEEFWKEWRIEIEQEYISGQDIARKARKMVLHFDNFSGFSGQAI